jgi:ligand-binding sensor domain-containing protein
MKTLISSTVFCILVTFAHPLFAQQEISYTLQRIDSRNGLSNSSVNTIFQGEDKILWVGTWDGLNSFNGSSFKTFTYSQDPSRGIGNNVVEDITEDAAHQIWVCTVEGISRYKPSTGEFTHYFYNAKGKNVSEKQFILLTDHQRNPYIYSVASGLQRFNAASASFLPVRLTLPGGKIKQLLFTADGLLWVLLENGRLGSFQQSNGKMMAKNDFNSFTGIHSIHELNGELVITTPDGKVEQLTGNRQIELNHFPEAIKLIIPYEEHYIIAWEKKGCLIVDKNFQPSGFLKKEISVLQESQINAIHTSSDKILWLGTDGNGMAKISPLRKPFTLVSNTDAGLRDDKQVRTFEKVGEELWVGTKGNGILALPFPVNNNYAHGRRLFTETSGLSNNGHILAQMVMG